MADIKKVFVIREAPQKVVYLGWFLSEQSRKDLEAAFPLKYPGKQVDHVTFVFGPKPEVVQAFAAAVGQTAEGTVTGYYEDDKGQAVTIDVQSPVPATNKRLHVTLATAQGVKPVYSNELVAKPEAMVKDGGGLKLTGVYDYFPRTVPNP